jgi:hypothetical protein
MSDRDPVKNCPSGYAPSKVWRWKQGNGGAFASITGRPTSGATHETPLSVGRHPLQLYSLATPTGMKVTIMLEELIAAGHSGAKYDAWPVRIGDGDQFSSGFVGAGQATSACGARRLQAFTIAKGLVGRIRSLCDPAERIRIVLLCSSLRLALVSG